SLALRIGGFFVVMDERGTILYRGREIKTTVTSYKNGIAFGAKTFAKKRVVIKADDPESLSINGKKFRGLLRFIKNPDGRFLVVNEIGLEDYIRGILYHEVSHYWPPEALKAQAITCRTYALYQIRENKSRDFDVTSDVYSQVYGGRASERFRTNKAVDETQGMAILYQGKVIPAYYHATCAGHTEDASNLWNTDMPPLKGVACPFCKGSPHFSWHYVTGLDEIRTALIKAGQRIGAIKSIAVVEKNPSGRVARLSISDGEKTLEVSGKDLRSTLGHGLIRSANFNVRLAGADAVFEGTGWGHGAGMCQWGAYFMAKNGKSAEEILAYYYPGTNVTLIGF
ncbi:MAG: SpoIID/LytB domain-containing protein, partial [Candidatus Omnitrophica bacterium]|nr:SpoIID/LytB domain-containing protein [Candidatus Omnitrophota bacterium]